MSQMKKAIQATSKTLPKALTGIQGLDEITGGGLPTGRPTLVSGGAGSGKDTIRDWSSWFVAPRNTANPACSCRSRKRSRT